MGVLEDTSSIWRVCMEELVLYWLEKCGRKNATCVLQ